MNLISTSPWLPTKFFHILLTTYMWSVEEFYSVLYLFGKQFLVSLVDYLRFFCCIWGIKPISYLLLASNELFSVDVFSLCRLSASFHFCYPTFGVIAKWSMLDQYHGLSLFSSGTFKFLDLFKLLIHFELIFVNTVSKRHKFILLHVYTHIF